MSDSGKPYDPVVRTSIGIGQVAVILGLILVYVVGGYWVTVDVIMDPEVPFWLKGGLPAIAIGLTILFFTACTQRMKATKTDKYIEVKD